MNERLGGNEEVEADEIVFNNEEENEKIII